MDPAQIIPAVRLESKKAFKEATPQSLSQSQEKNYAPKPIPRKHPKY
jgi:hypothetical protein